MRRYRAGTRGESGALTCAARPYPLPTCPLYGICGGTPPRGRLFDNHTPTLRETQHVVIGNDFNVAYVGLQLLPIEFIGEF